MSCESTEHIYDEFGSRKLLKSGCKEMDWKNVKSISPYEIAYCIFTHGLSFNDVPEKRKKLVQKEIDKLIKEKDKKIKEETIKSVLAIYESDAIIHEFLINGTKMGKLPLDNPDTVVGYIFDPELFDNVKSANRCYENSKQSRFKYCPFNNSKWC